MSRAAASCVVVLLAVLILGVGSAHAEGFSKSSLEGAFVFQGIGTIGTIGPVDSPSVGRSVFDGQGGCTSAIRLNFGGAVLPLTSVDCHYTVEADGLGFGQLSVTYNNPMGGTFPAFIVDFVIVDTDEFLWVATD